MQFPNTIHISYFLFWLVLYQKEKYTDASPWEYYAASIDHYIIHPKTKELLERLLLMLRDQGEEAAFSYIRREVLKK